MMHGPLHWRVMLMVLLLGTVVLDGVHAASKKKKKEHTPSGSSSLSSSSSSSSLAAEWVWIGAITSSSARFKVKLQPKDLLHELRPESLKLYISSPSPKTNEETEINAKEEAREFKAQSTTHPEIFDVHAKGLVPGGQYSWRIALDSLSLTTSEMHSGSLSLPQEEGKPMNFRFAFSSCADENSDPKVISLLSEQKPFLFLHLGDFHYGDIARNDPEEYRGAYERVMQAKFGKALMGLKLPMAYMWDDHDFGPDNSDGTAPGREAAIKVYKEYVPHYDIPKLQGHYGPSGPIPQVFSIGRVRFILTDLRSERDPNLSRGSNKTVLGVEQKEWLKRELERAAREKEKVGLIVWAVTMPWLDNFRKWGYFPEERQELASYIRSLDLASKVVIVSGDAHMLALDNGSHSAGGMVVMHAAALGRPGSVKGGPYSHGAFPGSGQFGVVDVMDDGERVCYRYSGLRVGEGKLLEFDSCHPESTPPQRPYFPMNPIMEESWRLLRKVRKFFKKLWDGQVLLSLPQQALVSLAVTGLVYLLIFTWCSSPRLLRDDLRGGPGLATGKQKKE